MAVNRRETKLTLLTEPQQDRSHLLFQMLTENSWPAFGRAAAGVCCRRWFRHHCVCADHDAVGVVASHCYVAKQPRPDLGAARAPPALPRANQLHCPPHRDEQNVVQPSFLYLPEQRKLFHR